MNTSNGTRWEYMVCLFVVFYTSITYAISTSIKGDVWFNVLPSTKMSLFLCLIYLISTFFYSILKGVIVKDIQKTIVSFINLGTLKAIILFTSIGLMLGSFHSIKIMMPELVPFRWDDYFTHLDYTIHTKDVWTYFTYLDPYYYELIFFYIPVWFFVQYFATMFICFSNLNIKFRYICSYISVWIICGNIVPLLFMAVGPIYYERLTGNPRFFEISQRIFNLADERYIYSLLPDTLWDSYVTKSSFTGSGISAFPSVHVAISTLLFILACQHSKIAGVVGFLFLAATMVLSVHLGWHYAVDGYASIILVSLIWWFWGRFSISKPAQRKILGATAGPAVDLATSRTS